jgi:hypothetical protein
VCSSDAEGHSKYDKYYEVAKIYLFYLFAKIYWWFFYGGRIIVTSRMNQLTEQEKSLLLGHLHFCEGEIDIMHNIYKL